MKRTWRYHTPHFGIEEHFTVNPQNPIQQNNVPQNITLENVNELCNVLTKCVNELKFKDFHDVLENCKLKWHLYEAKRENELNYNLKYTQIIKKIVTTITESYKIIKTPGSIFIQLCFAHLEFYFAKCLVNCAADLADPGFMRSILIYPDIDVDNFYVDLIYKKTTPLNHLVKNLNTQNFYDSFECIKLLLNYGANPNIPDDLTIPIMNLINNNKLSEGEKIEIVEYFVNHFEIILDFKTKEWIDEQFRDGKITIKILLKLESVLKLETKIILEQQFKDMILYLETSEENKFIEEFNRIFISETQQYNNADSNILCLLIKAIKFGLYKAFDIIMEKTQININYRCEGFTPIKTACCYGNVLALRHLLKLEHLNIHCTDNLLITVITILDSRSVYEFTEHYLCFYELLKCNKIDVNETDQKGYSALHYAIIINNYKVIEELLKHGAYIGTRNIFNEFAITNLSTEIIEKCFDSFITGEGSISSHKNISTIKINYINLVPPKTEEINSDKPTTEMSFIEHIAESKYLHNLLQHPVIKSFLYMKWMQLAFFFHINFILYLFFYISLVLLTISTFTNLADDNNGPPIYFIILLSIGIAYLIIRETIQFIMCPTTYRKSICNYFELLLIFVTISFLVSVFNNNIKIKKALAVTTILMAVLELYLLITSLEYLFISEYLLMFKRVFINFLKSFAVFSVVILTFSLCFFILLHNENTVIVNTTEKKSTDYFVGKHEEQNQFNKFTNYIAIIKTIVMMTGEFDAGNMNFNFWFSYLIFLLFIFLVPIVLLNLLNGLAVGDTQNIRKDAELHQLINLIHNLSKYDKIFIGKIRSGKLQSFRRWLQTLYKNRAILFDGTERDLLYRLEINYNSNTYSLITNTEANIQPNLSSFEKWYFNIIYKWLKFDTDVIDSALSIIGKKQETINQKIDDLNQQSGTDGFAAVCG